MKDLPLRDQILHRSRDVLHRHICIDPVLVKEVDPVGPQPLQRFVGDLTDTLGPAVEALRDIAILEIELGRDDDIVA